ncbi:ABC transporter ATP-binding protein [Nonomuraea ferruginea]
MTTDEARGARPGTALPDGQPILETRELGVAIGGVQILSDVSLSVRRGEIMAVLGPNGAGKTTLFNMLTGLRRPTSGRIHLQGRDITDEPVFRRARLGLARSFQITSLFPSLTVLENVRLAAQAHLGGSLALWRRVRRTDPALDQARAALRTVGIADHADGPAAALSHGGKRKLEVALAIVGNPAVLILGEPTAEHERRGRAGTDRGDQAGARHPRHHDRARRAPDGRRDRPGGPDGRDAPRHPARL